MLRQIVVTTFILTVSLGLSAGVAFAEPKKEPVESKSKPKKRDNEPSREAVKETDKSKKPKRPSGPLDFTMKDIDGGEQDLNQYSGKVVLMVNVASKCGFTPQYKGLEAVYQKYRDKGFVVLAFPANDFGQQEPWPNPEIKSYCTSKYNVTFPMFAKVRVKGQKICPLYKYLTKKCGGDFEGEIQWNFTKFLVGRKGQVVGRFDTRTDPEDPRLIQAIEKALAEEVGENTKSRP